VISPSDKVLYILTLTSLIQAYHARIRSKKSHNMAKSLKKKAPRSYKYRYFVINIKIRIVDTTEDLPAREYSRIFREFYQEFYYGKSSKQKYCILQTQGQMQIGTRNIFYGKLTQLTDVNNNRWFNKKERSVDTTFKIPPEYAANAVTSDYVFIPSRHRFVYQDTVKDHIDPYSVKRYFRSSLTSFLSTSYNVDVDVESDISTIERILEAPGISRLYLRFNYSNNDFSKEMQEFVEDDMKNSNVSEYQIKAIQKPGNPIDINKSQILAGGLEASKSNGEADATIIGADGRKERLKTKDMPLKLVIESTKDEKLNTLVTRISDEFRES
jgi:hypothetical protein